MAEKCTFLFWKIGSSRLLQINELAKTPLISCCRCFSTGIVHKKSLKRSSFTPNNYVKAKYVSTKAKDTAVDKKYIPNKAGEKPTTTTFKHNEAEDVAESVKYVTSKSEGITADVISKPAKKAKPPKVKEYAVKKYLGFIDRYLEKFGKRFEEKYPKAFKIYRLVKDGLRLFFQDSKSYYTVAHGIWYLGQKYSDFSYHQLNNYRQIPHDMFRLAPVLLISILPFTNYVIFPIAYMFPRHLLCRQFWTDQQKSDFGFYYLKSRLQHYPKVETFLEKESHKIKNDSLHKNFREIIAKLREGEQPSVEELLSVAPLFEKQQIFGFDKLYRTHKVHMQWHVAKSWSFPARKSNLLASAQLLWETDAALAKESLHSLTNLDLQEACFYRGLNAKELGNSEMIDFLNNWLEISKHVTEETLSFLLHCNIFLAVCHPNNKKYLIKNVDVTKGVIK